MSFEYPIKPNLVIAKKLDQWALNIESSVSSAVKAAREKERAFESRIDEWIDRKESHLSEFIENRVVRFSDFFGDFSLSFKPQWKAAKFSLLKPLQVLLEGIDIYRQPPPPKPILDYEEAKKRGDRLALFLAQLIEPFKKGDDVEQLKTVLADLYNNKNAEFLGLLERFFISNPKERYEGNLILSDKQLGLDIYVFVWLPHQYTDPHRHESVDSLGIVLKGENGLEITWKSDGGVVRKFIQAGDIDFISRADTHQVINNDNHKPLITFEVFSSNFNVREKNEKTTQTLSSDSPPEEFNRAIEVIKKFLRNIWS